MADCPLLGDCITDDMLLRIARFFPAARDLLCPKLTSSRLAARIIAVVFPSAPSSGAGLPSAPCLGIDH